MANRIDAIRLFMYRMQTPRTPLGHRASRDHFFLRLRSDGVSGWSEFVTGVGQTDMDIITYTKCFSLLRDRPIGEAFAMVRAMRGIWPNSLTEASEIALLDLQGKLTGKSAAQLLVLNGKMPLRSVIHISDNDPRVLADKTAQVMERGKVTCIKTDLTGDIESDKELIRAIRQEAPQDKVMLIGAPHERYISRLYSTKEQIGMQLLMLYAAGMDACEDPVRMTSREWCELQEYTAELQLIAEVPMRVARRASTEYQPGMARYYNIRPGFTGSIFDTVSLAEKITETGGKLMIGDDGFIGPYCSIWQQIGIALGCAYSEIAEKPGRSDIYRSALQQSGTLFVDGMYHQLPVNGFGIELDETVLDRQSACTFDL